MKELPPFSASECKSISDYIPFRQTSHYLKARSGPFTDTHELLALCGYSRRSSYGKFVRHQFEWNRLKRNIPLRYLSVIGAEREQVEAKGRADIAEYDHALGLPFYPKNGIIRLMPAVYAEYKFEPFTPEIDCIRILQAYSKEKGLSTCINCPRIRTIWIEPSGRISHSYYFPTLTFTKVELIPSYSGEEIGTAFIK